MYIYNRFVFEKKTYNKIIQNNIYYIKFTMCEYDIGVTNTFLQQRREEVQWRIYLHLEND
jgi:hypothetical protein